MRRHSILFINRVIPPDIGATGRCLADLAGAFTGAGWRVGVLAAGSGPVALPEGITVRRAGGATRGRAFALLSLAALREEPHDVVVTMTDPPMLAALGPLLGRLHGCGLVHWSHDLYPDLLPVVGEPLPPILASAVEGSMRRALARHDAIVAIGDCMARRLEAKLPERRIDVIRNWADPSVREDADGAARLRKELGLEGRFVVAYAGNLGRAHPLEAVVEAAEILARDRRSAVTFLLAGDGSGRPRMEALLAERRPANVLTLPFQAPGRVGALLGAADLHIAAMADAAEGMLVPSKVAGIFAVGRPCLFLGPAGSSAAKAVTDWGAGAVLSPGDAVGIAAAIRIFASDHGRWVDACAAARRAHDAYSFEHASSRFIALAERVALARAVPGRMRLGAADA